MRTPKGYRKVVLTLSADEVAEILAYEMRDRSIRPAEPTESEVSYILTKHYEAVSHSRTVGWSTGLSDERYESLKLWAHTVANKIRKSR